ncbi:MAG: hypothetical protein RL557_962 [archaeon]|jgi:hypothetical protein
MNRRDFLFAGSIGLVGAALLESTDTKPKKISTIKGPSYSTQRLETLAEKGLPEEFRQAGFTLGDYVKRDSNKELLILAEDHGTVDRNMQARLLKHLVTNYGIDSLGVEGLATDSKGLFFPVEKKDTHEFRFAYVGDVPNERIDSLCEQFSKHHVDIPRYGIEDAALHMLINYLTVASDLKKPAFLTGLSKLPELPKQLRESDIPFDAEGNLLKTDAEIRFTANARNRAFAENIISKDLNAIICGATHADVSDHVSYKNKLTVLQDHLHHSYLIVYCQESLKKGRENRIAQR